MKLEKSAADMATDVAKILMKDSIGEARAWYLADEITLYIIDRMENMYQVTCDHVASFDPGYRLRDELREMKAVLGK